MLVCFYGDVRAALSWIAAWSRSREARPKTTLAGSSLEAPFGSILECPWIAAGLFLDCSWIATGLLLDCCWIILGLLLDCCWVVLGLLLNCYWIVAGFEEGLLVFNDLVSLRGMIRGFGEN